MTSSNGNNFQVTDLCAGNSPVTDEFPAQRPGTQSFDIFFDLRLKRGWVNNREAGDLRRHRDHYDVIVMVLPWSNTRKNLFEYFMNSRFQRQNINIWKITNYLETLTLCTLRLNMILTII